MQARCRGDAGEMQGEMQGRYTSQDLGRRPLGRSHARGDHGGLLLDPAEAEVAHLGDTVLVEEHVGRLEVEVQHGQRALVQVEDAEPDLLDRREGVKGQG